MARPLTERMLPEGGARGPTLRHASLVAAGLITTVVLLVGASLLALAERESSREEARTGVLATEPQPTDLLVLPRFDTWRGDQFPVLYVAPSEPGTSPVLPPGMRDLPRPGAAVVSPALDRAARRDPLVAARYPERIVLDDPGYENPEELLAWVRLPEEAVPADLPMERVSSFGGSQGEGPGLTVGLDEDMPLRPLAIGIVLCLGGPAAVILAVGVATGSPRRDRRAADLRQVVVPRRSLAWSAAMETARHAAPAAFLAAVAWAVAAPHIRVVPVVGRSVQPGDLAVDPLLLGAVPAAVVTAVVTAATITAALPTGRRERSPGSPERWLARRRGTLPLAIGLSVVAHVSLDAGYPALAQLVVGVIVALAGLVLLMPRMARSASTARWSDRWPHHLARGVRRLDECVTHRSRWVWGLAGTVVVVLVMVAYVSVVRADQRAGPGPRSPLAFAEVIVPPGAGPAAWRALDGTLGPDAVVAPTSESDGVVVLHVPCDRLATLTPLVTCGRPGHVDDGDQQALARALGIDPDMLVVRPGRAPEPAAGEPSTALVIGPSTNRFEQMVRTASMQTLMAPVVNTAADRIKRPSPVESWLLAGMRTGAALVALAMVLTVADAFVRRRGDSDRTELGTFAAAYALVAGASLTLGVVLSWILVRMHPPAGYPMTDVLTVTAAVAAVGALCGGLISTFVRRERRALAAGSASRPHPEGFSKPRFLR